MESQNGLRESLKWFSYVERMNDDRLVQKVCRGEGKTASIIGGSILSG